MYKIKEIPEDFNVTEKIELKIDENGEYAYFRLTKKGYNTVAIIERIAQFLKIKSREVGFAGNKDKTAVTKQAISVKDLHKQIQPNRFEKFNSEDVFIEYIGRGNKPISLGDLEGNYFEIVVKECESLPHPIKQFINYFDEQRFSETNKECGKAIIKGDMKLASSMIKSEAVKTHLEKNPTDNVGAIKKIPLKTRMLIVNSYQSYLWNETASQYLKNNHKKFSLIKYSCGELVIPKTSPEQKKIPIIGFGMEYEHDISPIIKKIMKQEEITERNFIIKQMPELSAEGGMRELLCDVNNLKIEKISEKDFCISFFLKKGCYATMAVKQMMS